MSSSPTPSQVALNLAIRDHLESNHFDRAKLRILIMQYATELGIHELDVAMSAMEYLRWLPVRLRKEIQTMKLGDDKVYKPGPMSIFVFGSNTKGIHGAGAAYTARTRYGAQYGKGEGLSGESYAIPTKDAHLRTLSLETIRGYVIRFLEFAEVHREYHFFVTRIGCGLAGLKDEDVAPLFKAAPPNVELPYGWTGLADSSHR